ncbi:Hypothetical_protein [Hexamita inflata]|uniref:Hypothetical_protein n=1 Tax=Hexamita inflata TaxID=28002 RepID=A0AA86QXY1_9EUKA|nr:Hypothetical protein HINF_LOCUS52932 [Hexamita inflata]
METQLIIEPDSDISKIQIINFILLPNSKKHFEGPPLYCLIKQYDLTNSTNSIIKLSANNDLISNVMYVRDFSTVFSFSYAHWLQFIQCLFQLFIYFKTHYENVQIKTQLKLFSFSKFFRINEH